MKFPNSYLIMCSYKNQCLSKQKKQQHDLLKPNSIPLIQIR